MIFLGYVLNEEEYFNGKADYLWRRGCGEKAPEIGANKLVSGHKVKVILGPKGRNVVLDLHLVLFNYQ